MNNYIPLFICVIFSSLASILLKHGAENIHQLHRIDNIITNKFIWLGAAFYALTFISYIVALRVIPLSIAQPVITTGASVITVIAAVILYNETMFIVNWIGIALICSGLFLLFYGHS